MKKVFAAAAGLAICLSLSACADNVKNGKDSSQPTQPSTSTTTTADSQTQSSTNTTTTADSQTQSSANTTTTSSSQTQPSTGDKDISVADYIATIQDELDQSIASLKDSGMGLKVEARGNSLVYSYQYDSISNSDALKASLDQAMETMASTFETVLKSLKKEVASAESVIVEYLDKDGEVITSKEFK